MGLLQGPRKSRKDVRLSATGAGTPPKPVEQKRVNYAYQRKVEVVMNEAGFASSASPVFAEYLKIFDAQVATVDEISADDGLIVVDMQRDLLPKHDRDNPHGGRFGIAEGDHILMSCVSLIELFSRKGGTIVATRDYHPAGHVSFLPQGGPFIPHCIQGSEGAKFLPPIAGALAKARRADSKRVHVAFKGMHEDVDSFAGFPYREAGSGRVAKRDRIPESCLASAMGSSAAPWTGALVLKQSAILAADAENAVHSSEFELDMDTPPDVFAPLNDGLDRKMATMHECLKSCKRIFVCGLALDYTVLDTCVNAKGLGYEQVSVVLDATRPAHIPGIGAYGSGFLSDPAKVREALMGSGVLMTSVRSLIGKAAHALVDLPSTFPKALGPFELCTIPPESLPVRLQQREPTRDHLAAAAAEYRVAGDETLAMLGLTPDDNGDLVGTCSPRGLLPPGWPGAPEHATHVCWAYKTDAVLALQQSPLQRGAFLGLSTSPILRFIVHGGFLLLDELGSVVALQSICIEEPDPSKPEKVTLSFCEPVPFSGASPQLSEEHSRLMPVNIPYMRAAGATRFCWVNTAHNTVQDSQSEGNEQQTGFLCVMEDGRAVFFATHTIYQ